MDPSELGARHAWRLAHVSRWLARACLLLVIGLPPAVAWMWWRADATLLAVNANLPPEAIRLPLQDWQRWVGAALTEMPLALLLIGVWQARRCFLDFATGQVFTGMAVRQLKRFAAWTLASVLLNIAASAAVSVLLTIENPRGTRHLALGLGSDHLFMLFFAALVWLMAAVIGQGQALSEENARFV